MIPNARLPTRIEDVTPERLTSLMAGHYPGLAVEEIEIVNVVHGTTTKARLRLSLNEAGKALGVPEHICLKSNLEAHVAESLSHGLYDTEASFYRDLRPLLPVAAPISYFAASDPDSGQGIIVMEDLVLAGAQFGRNTSPVTIDEAAAALEDFATLHAAWWGSNALDSLGWLKTALRRGERPEGMVTEIYGGEEAFDHRFNDAPERRAVIPDSVRDAGRFVRAYDKLVDIETASTAPRCIIHGDTHLGNSYRSAQGQLCWLDWQLVRKGSYVRDINYFLGAGLTVENRRAEEQHLVRHYLDVLASKGVDAPSFEKTWEEYRRWPVFGLFCWSVTQDYKQPRDINIATIERFATSVEDHDTYAVLGV